MKAIKLIFLCVCAMSLMACSEDDDPGYIESEIIGRSWTGEVGAREGDLYLISSFYFGSDGFGEEIQFCPDCGRKYGPYTFQWYWEDRYSNNLVLDYGKRGVCFMDDLRLHGRHLYGIFEDEVGGCFDFELCMD